MIPLTSVQKTLSGLVSRVRTLTQDFYGDRFPDDRVIEALNDAAVDVAERCGVCRNKVVIRLFEGLVGYDVMAFVSGAKLSGESLRDFNGIERLVFDGADVVKAGGVDEFFRVKDRRWTPDFSEFGKFMLFSPPSVTGDASGAGNNVTVTYAGLPFPMVDGSDRPDPALPMCDEALCLLAASELLMEGDVEDFKRGLEFLRRSGLEIRRALGGLNRKGYAMEMTPL